MDNNINIFNLKMSNKLYLFFNINKLNKKFNTIISKLSFRNSPEKSTFELNEEKIEDHLVETSIIYQAEETKVYSEEETKIDSEEDTKIDFEEDTKIDFEEDTKIDFEEDTKINFEEDTKINFEEDTKIDSDEETKINFFEDEYYVFFSFNGNYYLINEELTKCTCKAYKYCKTSIKTCKHLEFCINLKNNNEKALIKMKKSTIFYE